MSAAVAFVPVAGLLNDLVAALDEVDLTLVVTLLLAGANGEVDADLAGGGLRALLHGDEERVRRILRDEGDSDFRTALCGGC